MRAWSQKRFSNFPPNTNFLLLLTFRNFGRMSWIQQRGSLIFPYSLRNQKKQFKTKRKKKKNNTNTAQQTNKQISTSTWIWHASPPCSPSIPWRRVVSCTRSSCGVCDTLAVATSHKVKELFTMLERAHSSALVQKEKRWREPREGEEGKRESEGEKRRQRGEERRQRRRGEDETSLWFSCRIHPRRSRQTESPWQLQVLRESVSIEGIERFTFKENLPSHSTLGNLVAANLVAAHLVAEHLVENLVVDFTGTPTKQLGDARCGILKRSRYQKYFQFTIFLFCFCFVFLFCFFVFFFCCFFLVFRRKTTWQEYKVQATGVKSFQKETASRLPCVEADVESICRAWERVLKGELGQQEKPKIQEKKRERNARIWLAN